ncbi:TGF beta induced protein ig-h3 precursor [Venturia nashicola]|nr:TGF beta induced protein ig-h3 precursor [Venturia nashicola]
MLVGTLICLSAAWLARAQTSKGLQSVLSSNGLSSFLLYLAQFPTLSDQLKNGNVTILAPSDTGIGAYLKSGEAVSNYSAELQANIQYHVLPGHFPGAQLKQAQQFLPTSAKDIPYNNVTGSNTPGLFRWPTDHFSVWVEEKFKPHINSTIYVIDSMLTLPLDYIVTAKRTGISNFVDLVASLPHDPSFATNSTIPYASNSTTEALYSIEAYHVLKGVFFSPDLADAKVFTKQNGASVTITVQDGDTFINDAKIIASDYLISEGVMHVLDKPLSPQRPEARPPPPSWKRHLPTGAYIGIAVVVVLVVFTVAVSLWHLVIRRRRDRCNQQENNNPFADERYIRNAELPDISRKFSGFHNNPKPLVGLHPESAIYHELGHNTSIKDKKRLEAREMYELG